MVVTTVWFAKLHLLLIPKFLPSNLTTCTPLPDNLLLVFHCKYEVADYDCSFILIGAPIEAAQPNPICQDQSMLASA